MGDAGPDPITQPAEITAGAGGATAESLLQRLGADRKRLREVAARAVRAQEAERTRLARELQEEFAQRLAGILLRLPLARNATEAAAREEHFEELRRQVVELTTAVNQYAKGLHPPALTELGPIASVQAYARLLTEASRLRILFEGDDIRGLLTPERELALYRIAQEALANVVRHAAASEARVLASFDGDFVEVRVSDDGRGFDLEEIEANGGCIGILGMQERAIYVGGEVRVESRPGAGTTVTLRMPVRVEKPPAGDPLLPVTGSPLGGVRPDRGPSPRELR